MLKTIIRIKEEIIIKKGTIIPNLFNDESPILYHIIVSKGSDLIKYGHSCSIKSYIAPQRITEKPVDSRIYTVLFEKALEEGAEPTSSEDGLQEFKAYLKNSKHDGYLSSIYAVSHEEAIVKAKKNMFFTGLDYYIQS